MFLVFGLGFPPFLGGLLRYADKLGAAALLKGAEKYAGLGAIYQPSAQIEAMAKSGERFYPPVGG